MGLMDPVEPQERYIESKLSFIDLAGSERVCMQQNMSLRITEGSNINKSLLALGKVINKLSEKKAGIYIPYRDSKLTRLLKDSLGGNTRTVLITCITPNKCQKDETLHSLNYAFRAKKIKTDFQKNQFRKIDPTQGFPAETGHGRGSILSEVEHGKYLQEINMLRNQIKILQSQLAVEKGGRSEIEKRFEELANQMEEQLEIKSSLDEL